jgi:hypothetical protein
MLSKAITIAAAVSDDQPPVLLDEVTSLAAQFWRDLQALAARGQPAQRHKVFSTALSSLSLHLASPIAREMLLSAARSEAAARQQVLVSSSGKW